MKSGIYLVTLKNEQPISVNAHDKRISKNCIKVNRSNCKVGKAKDFHARATNYFKTFGGNNVIFEPLFELEEIDSVEQQILATLDEYRIRGITGRKNEWLECISPDRAKAIVTRVVKESGVEYTTIKLGSRIIFRDPNAKVIV